MQAGYGIAGQMKAGDVRGIGFAVCENTPTRCVGHRKQAGRRRHRSCNSFLRQHRSRHPISLRCFVKTETLARALSHAHNLLLRDLRGLGRFIQPDADGSIVELRSRLASTYTDVCEHFRLEERGGYLDNMQVREPRLQRIIAELGAEHLELREALEEIRSEAAVARDMDDVLRYKVRTWIDRLLQHETRENDVVQDAVDSDLGAAD
jgi:hypothetical protein